MTTEFLALTVRMPKKTIIKFSNNKKKVRF